MSEVPEGLSEREAAGIQLLRDAYERWSTADPVRLAMTRQDAWVVMMGLQMVVSHQDLAGGPMAQVWERVGRGIQEAVSDDARLYALAEAGWNRAFDVDTGPEQKES